MNNLLKWVYANDPDFPFKPHTWTRVVEPSTHVPQFWSGPTRHKILGLQLPEHYGHNLKLDPYKTTILGGICSIFTAESERIRKKELTFKNSSDFEKWIYFWYPRIDQIHDTVGIPPKFCPQVIYVCEDSIFAERLAKHTGLDKEALQVILKRVHIDQGHRIVCNWLKSFGYQGNVEVVYTSEIAKEIELGLALWERMLGFPFAKFERNTAKVKLMYTGIWADILGVRGSAIIYEPASHMYLETFANLSHWTRTQQYGTNINHDVGIIGYLPFWLSQGFSRTMPYEQLPNYSNYKNYEILPEDLHWYAVNLFFSGKEIVQKGPNALSDAILYDLIKKKLNKYYQ